MDMQKDFIHIDEVFKRAADGEEQERSGAWLRMKDLLDKEMPVGASLPARGGRLRRLLPFLLVLLLAGGAASYYAIKSPSTSLSESTEDPLGIAATSPTDKSMVTTNNSIPALPSAPQTPGSPDNAASVAIGSDNELKRNDNRHLNNHATPPQSTRKVVVNQPSAPVYLASNSPVHPKKEVVLEPLPQPAAQVTTEMIIAPGQEGASIIERKKILEQIHPQASVPSLSNDASSQEPAMLATSVTLGQTPVVRTDKGTYYKEERDTFTQIDIVRRVVAASSTPAVNNATQTPVYLSDTLAVKRVERLRYVPLTKMEMISLAQVSPDFREKATVEPVANIYRGRMTTTEQVAMVPLANYMVNRKKVDKKKLNNFFQETSNTLAAYFDGTHKFYLGALVGGNMGVGNPLGVGMQFGLAGLYSVSERVVLSAEARVMNHTFGNYTLADTRTTYDINSSQLPGGAWLFFGKEYTATNNYRLRQYTQIEVPLMINYALGRMAVYGGPSFFYAFPMKWEQSQTFSERPIEEQHLSPANPYLNTGYEIDAATDFSNRLGLGFVTGITYDFSRTLSLDVRMSKSLWSNHKAEHAGINRLYNNPKLQLSIGYYFGRRDKVVYIMQR